MHSDGPSHLHRLGVVEPDGVQWFEAGRGPVVVVPWPNLDWTTVDLSALRERLRVVIVAPRGFGPNDRPGSYDPGWFVADVARVVERLGVDSDATFGYSMSGAMAARLAIADPRVTAVACGGFPLTADLSGMGARARARHTAARREPAAWAEVTAAHDPEAAVAFWDDVSGLPRAALADVGCPVRAWWGERDTTLSSLLAPEELERDLTARGIAYDVIPGLDHDGMHDRLDLVLPTIATWLADVC